ncbi:nucleotidyltransferase domain-containing protein [Neobacillus notoginsengisoli]|uniref:nucleotidyltransferase domain-containing protein n=1 Tax=Neobacillus notoginsengisoli TaxID=1578198 RepID=UPI001EFF6480|nr:nucleotidyltransferase domain-containing protein [Neobacillus notoginsengisoli]
MERDLKLPESRAILLKNALDDLTADPDVLAIYQGGSLAKGNFDHYSDIDLHTIVLPEKKNSFVREKKERAKNWGEVLFYEDFHPSSPVIVTHYSSFVKIDSWYHFPEEIKPSIWLKGCEVLYDPKNLIGEIIKESTAIIYKPSTEEVLFWRGKVLAFIHETYRAVMREEFYYALANLDRIRWLVASGWYMKMDQHLDSPYGVWSKIEGKRSKLAEWQQSLLSSWDCSRNANQIMMMLVRMIPEILRLNTCLSLKVDLSPDHDQMERIMKMVY